MSTYKAEAKKKNFFYDTRTKRDPGQSPGRGWGGGAPHEKILKPNGIWGRTRSGKVSEAEPSHKKIHALFYYFFI